jgi:hypothetical protein
LIDIPHCLSGSTLGQDAHASRLSLRRVGLRKGMESLVKMLMGAGFESHLTARGTRYFCGHQHKLW